MIIEFEPEQQRYHHACENRNTTKSRSWHKMLFSCIGLIKKLEPFYHKNYRRNRYQCKDKCHHIGKNAKLEIRKIDTGLQQVEMVVHWIWRFQDKESLGENKKKSVHFQFSNIFFQHL